MSSIYQDKGYKDRKAYLQEVADMHRVPIEAVHSIAEVLGPGEDFDGLIAMIEDFGSAYEEL